MGCRAVNSSWVYGECQSALAEFGCVESWFVARPSYVIVVLVGWFTGVVCRVMSCLGCLADLGWSRDLNASVDLASCSRLEVVLVCPLITRLLV